MHFPIAKTKINTSINKALKAFIQLTHKTYNFPNNVIILTFKI